ncbi:MAG TPA: cupin domain-containing protein [Kofleriaceae bacterium]|nr:cupin domain-containing protein [Kofleriaceae bacterium]
MSERRHPNVINRDEVQPTETKKGKHQIIARGLGRQTGSSKLGASLTEIPPGAISYPFHYHCAKEEALYIISGTGTARIGDARVAVRAGDWIAYPVGPAHAHQMINDGSEPLVYLAISTGETCEVVGYPDSNKVAMAAGESFQKMWIRQISRAGESLDYWDGEPGAQ